MYRWVPDLPAGFTTYPSQIETMQFFSATPTAGAVICEVRLDAWEPGGKRLWLVVEMYHSGRLWMRARVSALLYPLGPFANLSEAQTAAFLEKGSSVAGVSLSAQLVAPGKPGQGRPVTRLKTSTVRALDFLPGTLAHAFRTSGDLKTLTLHVAVKEHVARQLGIHPAEVTVDEHLLGQFGPERIRWNGDEVEVAGDVFVSGANSL